MAKHKEPRKTLDDLVRAYVHGGARVGAGRRKKEKTVVIRVPESLETQVRQMIAEYKSGSQEEN